MAKYLAGLFENTFTSENVEECAKFTSDFISTSKILVVGAGGIGCELLKNLVMTGFEEIHVIDLDTIELSNLNRQFLFQKQHIGKPKAVVARESVLKFNPNAKIIAYHDSITNTKFDVDFFKQFKVITNALDNIAARTHVNRMCLCADVPLIESGSSGYLGQVTVYKKGLTECYECLPRKQAREYPGCTIRNTPSEPVHCVVWAKHLFNQLFGESDADNEVSPDVADLDKTPAESAIERKSTREWAKESDYDPKKIFQKLFHDDINYLLEMKDLWEKRKPPKPLVWVNLPDAVEGGSEQQLGKIKDQIMWNMKQCAEIFASSIEKLKEKANEGGPNSILTWDKDDDVSMDFVASTSNLRAYCFQNIKQLNRFDLKALAGSIIPAIATTNAVIAGLIVLQVFKVLKGDIPKCKTAFLYAKAGGGRKLISNAQLEKPNPNCLCSDKDPQAHVLLNLDTLTVRTLDEKILKEKLHMVQPDIMFNGNVLLSSDPEDNPENIYDRKLSSFDIHSGDKLLCHDFFQQYKVYLNPRHVPEFIDQDFRVENSEEELLKRKEEYVKKNTTIHPPSQTTDDDMCIVEVQPPDTNHAKKKSLNDEISPIPSKKKASESENGIEPPPKRAKTAAE